MAAAKSGGFLSDSRDFRNWILESPTKMAFNRR
jgi:hypothetical protein